ncbi:MAG TPA: hypothetical protein VMC81_04900 [Rhodocyclaceae bacterium]|nr:hypothetical protein [Rhodocyclaceae bacterium]
MRARPYVRVIIAIAGFAVAAAGAVAAVGYSSNNADCSMPDRDQFQRARDSATAWIRANEPAVLDTENPALWHMLREAASLSNDPYLLNLYAKYYDRYLARNPGNVWHHLFDTNARFKIAVAGIDSWPDYGLLFMYGLTCQDDLRNDPRVRGLMEGRACGRVGTPSYFRDPACLTHQLMGVRFVQQSRCEDRERTDALADDLVAKIGAGTQWDFRVVDAYVQKVLMLAVSHAADRINPRWLVRILDAQQPDGGWDDFDPLIPLGAAGSAIGWCGRGLCLQRPTSNFHTTVQGLYLAAIMAES